MDVNAQLIKDQRTANNWTQQHLADACGLSLRTIQRVERYGNASNETVAALASVLEVAQSDIVIPERETETVESPVSYKPWMERLVLVCLSGLVGFGMAILFVK